MESIIPTKRKVGRPPSIERNNQIKKDKETMSWTSIQAKYGLALSTLQNIVKRKDEQSE